MEAQRLVHMANQIAAFFKAYPEPEAIAATATHIRDFWDPRMRQQLAALVTAGGDGLTPIARKAALALGEPTPAP
ncbi:MAG: formate dehydrogenase subunit delta [Alphaproteobacteria bacterium]